MLANLNEIIEKTKNELRNVTNRHAEITIPRSFAEIEEVVKVYKYTAIARTESNNLVYVPNQWFILAYYLLDLTKTLRDYQNHFRRIFSDNPDKKGLATIARDSHLLSDEDRQKVQHYFLDESERNKFITWLTQYDTWHGQKTVDRGDFTMSPVLHVAGVPATEQGYLHKLVLHILENPELERETRRLVEQSVIAAITYNSAELYDAWTQNLREIQYSIPKLFSTIQSHEPEPIDKRFLLSLQSKRFLILTGLAGSGKTRLAQAFAKWISPYLIHRLDPFPVGAIIEAESTTYTVVESDNIAIVLESKTNGRIVRAMLPRELIELWAKYIIENSIERDAVNSVQLRDLLNERTNYSNTNNSFHSPLKAAAFALITLRRNSISLDYTPYTVVSVGADWTNRDPVLGYYDALNHVYKKEAALELILRATTHPEIPHFLILDEMNLSHVERYFADMLSAMESDEPILLHDIPDSPHGVPSQLPLPQNLFIIGTVNVDETTYMFSPKVLDRANVIEFRTTANAIEDYVSTGRALDLELLTGKGAQFAASFVSTSSERTIELPGDILQALNTELGLFFKVLAHYGMEFGFRTAAEIKRYVYFHWKISDPAASDISNYIQYEMTRAVDAQILQKLLPRLHGSRRKLEPILRSLTKLCSSPELTDGSDAMGSDMVDANWADSVVSEALLKAPMRSDILDKVADARKLEAELLLAKYPLSYEKIIRMLQRLEDGFTSFAEA